ncbi:alanine racemase [Agrococcus carbonis]|uniref:D-serine deaminase, pyridoxal phosphate-dependent n=1 Tax=Agrococcus carbonis TaxID=684552 RepID=A0A1H1LZ91_9MICO|nr:alanine racemase [Agrococcus carbonis]SDR79924.1 D-serine deaminase, pyridoxal phosphate-dependent [Agrococcus carbonis]
MSLPLADAGPWSADGHWERLDAATSAIDGPFAALSLEALAHNLRDMVTRAAGTPLRLATKSVRSRPVIEAVLQQPGWRGVLAATLPEALWLSATVDDVLLGYPTVDRGALRALVADERALARVTLMVDSVEHLDAIDAAVARHPELRVAVELDSALEVGPMRFGVRRSPQRAPAAIGALARAVAARPGFRLVGLMSYEAQHAGVPDAQSRGASPAFLVRAMQRMSAAELLDRRAAAVAAAREVGDLEFVNGGGTGSIETTAADPVITEIGAGSGVFGPHLFDGYRSFSPAPALAFALPVVRRPGPGVVTLLGGGWIASGPRTIDRDPVIAWPSGLRLASEEGAGEVQTPVLGRRADALRLGDRVWMRHAKAGEPCERTDTLHVVAGDQVVSTLATYRGEGRTLL